MKIYEIYNFIIEETILSLTNAYLYINYKTFILIVFLFY